MTVRVGLTGGIASGKSTVSAILAELGAVVIDADLIAREVVARGTPGLAAVVAEFGPGLLTPDGRPRPARAWAPWSSPTRRRAAGSRRSSIRSCTSAARSSRPRRPRARSWCTTSRCWPRSVGRASFDAVVVVDAPPEIQVARMVEDRGWSREEAESRIAAQATREDRLAIATYVVRQHRHARGAPRAGRTRSTRRCIGRVLTFPGRQGPAGSLPACSRSDPAWP